MADLLDSYTIGDLMLKNRIIMAPMTRARAQNNGLPTALMSEYYSQRADAGLIISEATNVSPLSCPFDLAPGLYSHDHVEAWKDVTKSVHQKGGKIFAQLWHGGRIGAMGTLNWQSPLSPSGYNDDVDSLHVWSLLHNGNYARISATPSRAMTTEEVYNTIKEYKQAAKNALDAGFDGVEIHAANGYLPHQFLSAHVNRREDEFGGSIENRVRFLEMLIDSISDIVSSSRIGVRISPYTNYNNALDEHVFETYSYLMHVLEKKNIGYLHIADVNGWYGSPDLEKILNIISGRFTGTDVC